MIRIDALSHRYPGADRPALDNIDLSIPAGGCFGLLGPNGAGKTTLLSLLCGILPVQAGRIRVDGRAVTDREIRRFSALVPQEYAFYETLTGRENLEVFAGFYGLSRTACRDRIDFATTVCGLGSVLSQRAGTYSGGIKRRLNLAIGLLNRPRVLYLDEPTVGIDAQSRHFILESIRGLKDSGMTIVYTSHYMEEVQALCDRLAIIDHGRLRTHGALHELLDRYGSASVRLRTDRPLTEDQHRALAGIADVSGTGQDWRLVLRADGDFSRLARTLMAHAVPVNSLHYGGDRLEDTYLAITDTALREA